MSAEPHVHHAESQNPFIIAQHQLKTACDLLGLNPGVYEVLREPARVYTVSIPVQMDSGEIKSFLGFRSQHTDVIGPTKGGIRFHPDLTLDEVKALSIWMTMKCSLLDLPYGGGKGGIICNPKEMSPNELEQLSRGYVRALAPNVGPQKDIPAPDVYTTPQIMAWMMDEFSKIEGYYCPGVITGKPLSLGGSLGRREATARGCTFTIREAASRLGIDLSEATAVIQGYGNAGSIAATLLQEMGVTIVGASDSKGAIYNPEGLEPEDLAAHKASTGSVANFPGSRSIPADELLEIECDILVPAALENVITSHNAGRIQAKIIAEAANGPTTPEADAILFQRGVLVIPDILANAGGVTVSYFEWTQNLTNFYWTEDEVNQRLEQKMVDAFERTYQMCQDRNVNMRLAAYMVSLERLAEALTVRSWVK